MGLMSKARGLGLGIMIWALTVPIFLFTIFPLVSSTSTGTSGIYLLEYKWNDEDHSWLRLGYYGLCIVHNKHGGDRCLTTTGRSSKDLVKAFHIDTDHYSIFDYPLKLQHDVFVAFLTAGGVVWLISLILISLVILKGSSAGRLIRSAAKITSLAGATLMIASAWATNSAVKALEVNPVSSLQGGTLLYGLQWVAAILAFITLDVSDAPEVTRQHTLHNDTALDRLSRKQTLSIEVSIVSREPLLDCIFGEIICFWFSLLPLM